MTDASSPKSVIIMSCECKDQTDQTISFVNPFISWSIVYIVGWFSMKKYPSWLWKFSYFKIKHLFHIHLFFFGDIFYDLSMLFWFVLLFRGSQSSERADFMPKTIKLEVVFSQWLSEPSRCWTCQYFSSQKQSVSNQARKTHVRQKWNTLNILLHTLSAETTFLHLHWHNRSSSCCQTGLPPLRRQLTPEHFVPHWIKHTLGHWDIKTVKSNEATRLPFEPCLSDPPPFQIIVSDSQMCPSLEMWLMSNLVSEDLRAGFESRIKGLCLLLGICAVSVLSGKWVHVMVSF